MAVVVSVTSLSQVNNSLHKINMQKNQKSELGRKDVCKVHSYIFLCCKTLSFVIIDPSESVLVVVTTNCSKKKNPR